MATQEHLYCERESCSFFDKKRSPHVFLIVLKFDACHETPSRWCVSRRLGEMVLLDEREETGRLTARPLPYPPVSGSRFRYWKAQLLIQFGISPRLQRGG